MRFQYTPIFSISGVNLTSGEVERELVVDSSIPFRAFLTTQPDIHLFESDRSLAMAGLVLRAIFRHDPKSDQFKQLVENAVEEVRARRRKEGGNHPFLVIVAEGEVDLLEPAHVKESEDFVVWLNDIDNKKIRSDFEVHINALMNSIFSAAEKVAGIKKLGDAVVFFREDDKPIYSYTLTPGSARLIVSRVLTEDKVQEISLLYRAFVKDTFLQRVQQLIKSSFEIQDDQLRSFLAAWSAIEIFINKVFPQYEKVFFDSMLEEGQLDVQRKYLERIRTVMNDKYRLVDKFAVISLSLAPSSADQDLQTLKNINKIRNELLHGQSIDEQHLPVESLQELVNQYIRLHIQK